MQPWQRPSAARAQTPPASITRNLRKRLVVSTIWSFVSVALLCLALWRYMQPGGTRSPALHFISIFVSILVSIMVIPTALASVYEWMGYLIVHQYAHSKWLWRARQMLGQTGNGYGALAAVQPVPIPSADLASRPIVLGPLPNPAVRSPWAFVLLVIVQTLAGVGSMCYFLFRLPQIAMSATVQTLIPPLCVAGAAYYIWSGATRIWSELKRIRPVRFIADDTGLTHVIGGRAGTETPSRGLSWSEARTRYAAGAGAGILGVLIVSALAARAPALPILAGAGVALVVALIIVPNFTKRLSPLLHGQLQQVSLPWAEIRGLVILAAWRNHNAHHTVYAVYSHRRLFTWTIASDAPAAEQAAHDALCSLIVAHTGLPLRDVSSLAEISAPELATP